MSDTPLLAIYYIWHPNDDDYCRENIKYIFNQLQRNTKQLFSRGINIPIFFRTSLDKKPPSKIEKKSQYTIVFPIWSYHWNQAWYQYYENLPKDNFFYYPFALNTTTGRYAKGGINYCNLSVCNPEDRRSRLMIETCHKIYTTLLSIENKTQQNEENLKFFISFTREEKLGEKIARQVKERIDSERFNVFFDEVSIGQGNCSKEDIMQAINSSSILCIYSDALSSRYWGQLEMLKAKENNRPIIGLDCLKEYEDRRYPYAANIPYIRLNISQEVIEQLNNEENIKESKLEVLTSGDLDNILEIAARESVSILYKKCLLEKFKKDNENGKEYKIFPRPPEALDLKNETKDLKSNSKNENKRKKIWLYPDPPIYEEELDILKSLVTLETPLSNVVPSLKDKSIAISISHEEDREKSTEIYTEGLQRQLAHDLTRHCFHNGANFVYGGDFRKNNYSSFICDEAMVIDRYYKTRDQFIKMYYIQNAQGRSILHLNKWMKDYNNVVDLTIIESKLKESDKSGREYYNSLSIEDRVHYAQKLTEMRRKTVNDSDFRVCAGGKLTHYAGRMPGILEEVILALKQQQPLFLVGGFGGLTGKICQIISTKETPEELTEQWQITNNPYTKKLLSYIEDNDSVYYPNYNNIIKLIKESSLNNGLTEKENQNLFKSQFIDEIIYYIFLGIKRLVGEKNDT